MSEVPGEVWESDDWVRRTLILPARLAERALTALAERNSPMVVPAFFLKVLSLEGSAPLLDMCVSCGEEDDDLLVAFDLVEGGVLCRSCRRVSSRSGSSSVRSARTMDRTSSAVAPARARYAS